jgi:hypothetical protein
MRRLILDDSTERLEVFGSRFPGCVLVSTYEEAIQAMNGERFDEVWLDHDLGTLRNGCDVAYWMATELPPIKLPGRVIVHSWNPAGARAIATTLQPVGINAEISPFNPDRLF